MSTMITISKTQLKNLIDAGCQSLIGVEAAGNHFLLEGITVCVQKRLDSHIDQIAADVAKLPFVTVTND